jgi:hypothetical protein
MNGKILVKALRKGTVHIGPCCGQIHLDPRSPRRIYACESCAKQLVASGFVEIVVPERKTKQYGRLKNKSNG